MIDVPYFHPHEEGPLFPEDAAKLVEETGTFLDASNRDVDAEVAKQNISDRVESSFKNWAAKLLNEANETDDRNQG